MALENTLKHPLAGDIKFPAVFTDITLMSPGNWNGFEYSSDEIKKAFEMTDWYAPNVSSLFLDHPENPNNASKDWAGKVLNPRLMAGSVKGDLEVWDIDTIIKIQLAGAKFGVSPRVMGEEIEGTLKNFKFDNFSIVSKPAIDDAYINLSKKYKDTDGVNLYRKNDPCEVDISLNLNSTDMKGGNNEMSENQEEKTQETKSVEPKKESESQEVKSEEKTEEAPAEESAEATEATGEMASKPKFSDLSIEELSSIIEEAKKILDARRASTVKEMSAAIDAAVSDRTKELEKQVKELSAKVNKPAPATVPSSPRKRITAELIGVEYSEGVKELAAMLENTYG